MTLSFKTADRDTPYLARFVVEAVEGLDLSRLEESYSGRGSAAYHPRMLTSLLFYGGVTRVYSSRQLERATYDSVAFRYTAPEDPRMKYKGYAPEGKGRVAPQSAALQALFGRSSGAVQPFSTPKLKIEAQAPAW